MNSSKSKKQRQKPFFSFAFLFAICANFALSAILLLGLVTLTHVVRPATEVWWIFFSGFMGTLGILATSKMETFRTLIHEAKHAFVILLTGNKLTKMRVGEGEGHVDYELYRDKLHFGPLITLAPYFFPLLSLPVLAGCLLFEFWNKVFLTLLLSCALSFDLTLGISELHPHQNDLKSIRGGFFAGALYLAGFYIWWTLACLIWTVAGGKGFLLVGEFLVRSILKLAAA